MNTTTELKKAACAIRTGLHDKWLSLRKLGLVFDLDHTLLESTCDPRAARLLRDAKFNRDLYALRLGIHSFFVKLRPGVRAMLHQLSACFDIFVYTHASRDYAKAAMHLLDPECKILQSRYVCADDTPGATIKDLRCLLPCDAHRFVVIVDDRLGVWPHQTAHVVRAFPFSWFAETLNPIKKIEERAHKKMEEDNVLTNVTAVLQTIHTLWYQSDKRSKQTEEEGKSTRHVEEGKEEKEAKKQRPSAKPIEDTSRLLSNIKHSVLRGCHMVFVDLLDLSSDEYARARDVVVAQVFGAVCGRDVYADGVTHIVVLEPTAWHRLCPKKGNTVPRLNCCVVHLAWFYHSAIHYLRAKEDEFLLDPSNPNLANLKLPWRNELMAHCSTPTTCRQFITKLIVD